MKIDGGTIISKVLEVNIDNIKYKKFSNPNGPTYTIKKSDVMTINYENGDKDDFRNAPSQKATSSGVSVASKGPRMIKRKTGENNSIFISMYHVDISQKRKALKSDAPYITVFLGVTKSSITPVRDKEY